MNLSSLTWPAANILDSAAQEQNALMKALAVLGSHFPLDHLVARGVFTNWALLRFEFCTYLSHQSEKYKSSESVWEHGILMEMKEEIKSLKMMRRKMYSTVGTILKKKKELRNFVIDNTQQDGRQL